MLTKSLTCVVAVAALMLAGCHDENDSFSHATQHAHSTPPPPSSRVGAVAETTTAPTREVSLRPREIRFDEQLKPCELLLSSQVGRLGGDTRTPGAADTEPEWRRPTCVFVSPTRTWTVTPVTDTGVELLYDVPKLHQLHGQLQVGHADPIATAYPAYTAVDPARVALSCYLAVDTAKGQMLVIGIELKPPANKRVPCTEVRPIAEEAMRTLIT
ncbi:MAG: hypothetical protein QOF58_6582 [Pseudonocardiales bacterium]|jgi:hypothetical protein|nr:hypothetical protein [Pseudonocardiales bacterium]